MASCLNGVNKAFGAQTSPLALVRASLLGLVPTSVAGAPEWTRPLCMAILAGWATGYVLLGAMRVGQERQRWNTHS